MPAPDNGRTRRCDQLSLFDDPVVGVAPGEQKLAAPSPGRATYVPFTAVITAPERTTTDNTMAGIACAVP
jgi:hypothetical protein